MRDLICAAIAHHAVLEIRYHGGTRIIQPYIHGTSLAGHEVVSAYQLSGDSRSGASRGWKLFDVRHITKISPTGARFAVHRWDYNPDDPQIESSHCRLQPTSTSRRPAR